MLFRSESVRHELLAQGSPVRLSVVHPGAVKTNIVRSARPGAHATDSAVERLRFIDNFDRMARTTAAVAATRIVRGIERNEPRILIGRDARLMDWIQRLRPVRYWSTLAGSAARLMRSGDASDAGS